METEKTGLRSKLTLAVFVAVLGGFFILNRIISPPAVLQSERRAPAKLPVFSIKTVTSAEFMNKFENFAADTFSFREELRTLRAAAIFGVFLQSDKDRLYFSEEVGAGEIRPVKAVSVEQTADKIKKVADSLNGLNVYYAFVPDKSIYSGKHLPGFDPALAERLMRGRPDMDKLTFIPLVNALSADCFYKTDLHWNQVKIGGVLEALGAAMGFEADMSPYTENYAGEFQGVYAGQLALPIGTDSLRYLSCPSLNAYYLNEKTLEIEPAPVYDLEGFAGPDAYDIFLRGPQPLIVLENSAATTEMELYLFRDSFSSSLAPLLASAYARVTVIDLRYLDARMLSHFIEFKPGSDALFLYSSQILNNSSVLLVQ